MDISSQIRTRYSSKQSSSSNGHAIFTSKIRIRLGTKKDGPLDFSFGLKVRVRVRMLCCNELIFLIINNSECKLQKSNG